MRSGARRKPAALATVRPSSRISRKRSAFEPANPGWTLSEPGAMARFAPLEEKIRLFRRPDCVCEVARTRQNENEFAQVWKPSRRAQRGMHEDRQRRLEIDQGQRRQIRRPAFH